MENLVQGVEIHGDSAFEPCHDMAADAVLAAAAVLEHLRDGARLCGMLGLRPASEQERLPGLEVVQDRARIGMQLLEVFLEALLWPSPVCPE